MKYCEHCGNEINEGSVICTKCGCSVKSKTAQNNSNNTILTVAKVFMIISCVASPLVGILYSLLISLISAAAQVSFTAVIIMILIFCFLPLAWTIPMTVSVNRKIKENEPISMALKVCTLLFVNIIAGILLLCANDD